MSLEVCGGALDVSCIAYAHETVIQHREKNFAKQCHSFSRNWSRISTSMSYYSWRGITFTTPRVNIFTSLSATRTLQNVRAAQTHSAAFDKHKPMLRNTKGAAYTGDDCYRHTLVKIFPMPVTFSVLSLAVPRRDTERRNSVRRGVLLSVENSTDEKEKPPPRIFCPPRESCNLHKCCNPQRTNLFMREI